MKSREPEPVTRDTRAAAAVTTDVAVPVVEVPVKEPVPAMDVVGVATVLPLPPPLLVPEPVTAPTELVVRPEVEVLAVLPEVSPPPLVDVEFPLPVGDTPALVLPTVVPDPPVEDIDPGEPLEPEEPLEVADDPLVVLTDEVTALVELSDEFGIDMTPVFEAAAVCVTVENAVVVETSAPAPPVLVGEPELSSAQ